VRDPGYVLMAGQPDQKVALEGMWRVTAIALSPDGKWAAATGWKNSSVRVWEAAGGKPVRDLPGSRRDAHAEAVAFSPDNQWLVVGGPLDYRWWHVGSWKPGQTITKNQPVGWTKLAFARDGSLLALTPTPYTVRLVEPATGRELATLTPPDRHAITWLSLSADGGQLAAATQDHLVQLWDLHRLRQRLMAMRLDWGQAPSPSK
jgi:WD40 repeat protein